MHKFEVKGMTCGGCAEAVKRSVARVDPGAVTTVDLATGAVAVEGRADAAAIADAIRGAGFEVAAA